MNEWPMNETISRCFGLSRWANRSESVLEDNSYRDERRPIIALIWVSLSGARSLMFASTSNLSPEMLFITLLIQDNNRCSFLASSRVAVFALCYRCGTRKYFSLNVYTPATKKTPRLSWSWRSRARCGIWTHQSGTEPDTWNKHAIKDQKALKKTSRFWVVLFRPEWKTESYQRYCSAWDKLEAGK